MSCFKKSSTRSSTISRTTRVLSLNISCAHTCRAFLYRAQSHIFRYVPIVTRRLDDRDGSILPTRRIETFSDIVKKRPIIPRNIRILRLEISDDGAWLSQDVNFLFIMTLLDRSKELFPAISIMGENLDLDTIRFPTQREFPTCLWKPLVAPFITKLTLNNLEKVPIGIFLICPRLHFLRIAHISIDTKKRFGAREGQPQLKALEFYDSSQAVDDIFGLVNPDGPHVNPSFLRSLDVLPQISCLPRLMAATASSMEKLVIDDIECTKIPPSTFRMC